jgi:glutamate dehydrogenase (NADP+)
LLSFGYYLTNPIIEAVMSKTAGSILEATLKRDPHEVEFIQAVQEVVQALERVIGKNAQ